MLNKLLADIGNGLAEKSFERVSWWWWGPKWIDFISVDPPLSVDNPLWQREENSLKSIQLFGLSPDELQAEIIRYWQQPFWKRWFLSLFTSINSKIKLWSYYHRCLAFRKVCIKNKFKVREPISLVFEQYLGIELIHKLNKNRIQFEHYFEKHAGNLRIEKDLSSLRSTFIIDNWKFFSKLMQKKLSQLPTESERSSLQSQLKKEYKRLEMILHQYLSRWHENIFNPAMANEGINNGTFVEIFAGKEISYSIHAIKDWVKMKQQVIESILEEPSPRQFLKLRNLLEACFSRLRALVDAHLKHCVNLIVEERERKLNGQQAFKQAEILHTELIRFFRNSALLFHPDKSFANEELSKIQTELFPQFQQLAEKSLEIIKKDVQTLQNNLPKRRQIKKVRKIELVTNGDMPELEQEIKINFAPTHREREEPKVSIDSYIQSQVSSKLIHPPPNFIEKLNKKSSRRLRLLRYTPVF